MALSYRTCVICLLALCAIAGAQTWNGGSGTTSNWSDGANWVGGAAPLNTGAASVIFGGTARLTPLVDVPYSINSLTFNNTVGVNLFNIGGSAITIGAGGIVNNDADTQTIAAPVVLGASQTWAAASGALSIAGNVTIGANTLAFNSTLGTSTLSGVVSGTGFLTKDGAGSLTLAGTSANTFTGNVTVNGGTLFLGKTAGVNAFAGVLSIGDGAGTDTVTLLNNDQIPAASTLTIGSSGVFNLNGFSEGVLAANLNGGSITIGAGTLAITSNLTMTAGSISSTGVGKLVLGSPLTTNASATAAGISGIIDLSGGARNITVADGTAANDLDISASIVNGSAISKLGSGTLRYSGTIANTYAGQTTINAGTLLLAKGAANGAIPGDLIIGDGTGADTVRLQASDQIANTSNITIRNGGFLDLAGFTDVVNGIALPDGGATITTGAGVLGIGNLSSVAGASTSTISGILDLGTSTRTFDIADGAASPDLLVSANVTSGTLVKAGTGELRLSGNNTARITLNAGTLLLDNNGALGTLGATFNGGTVQSVTTRTYANPIALGGIVTFAGPDTLNLNGAITGSGAIVKNGSGALRLGGAAANTYGGLTTVNAGTLFLAKTLANGAIPANLTIGDGTSAASVRLEQSNQIPDGSTVTIRAGGLLDLAGNSDTVGDITFEGGGGAITTAAGTITQNGRVLLSPGPAVATIAGNISMGGGDRLFLIDEGDAVPDLNITANISNGNLFKAGFGELRLSGNNTATFTLAEGTLSLASNTALGTGTLRVEGGTIVAVGARTFSNPISLFIVAPVTDAVIAGPDSLTLSGPISGNGTIQKNGPGSLILTNSTETNVSFFLVDGLLSGTDLHIGPLSEFSLFNGTFTGTLTSRGNFRYFGGAFNGSLINRGTVEFPFTGGTFAPQGGLTNHTSITLRGIDNLAPAGTGLLNFGHIDFAGGSITSNSPVINNGALSGFGVIGGLGAFTNNGLISQGPGTLTLNSASNVNNGNFDMAQGYLLDLSGSALVNSGTINLNGGFVSGTRSLSNTAIGTVAGHGTITVPFTNNGLLLAQPGTTNITLPFSNPGTIQLAGTGASLVGGAIDSNGTIQGAGAVGNRVVNSGIVEPVGGTLIFSGAFENPTGTITAAPGNKVLFTTGFGINDSIINLTGGTFDNNNRPLSNFGQISGYGTFRASIFVNNGSMTFSGGTSTINGNVTNAASKQIKIAYNPAIFTGNVVNNGTFKNTSTTVTFAGSYTENGTFISDPADNFFSSVSIGENGAWVGGVGDRFLITGDLLSFSTNKTGWQTDDAELRFIGGLRHLLSALGEDRGIDFAGFDNNFAWGSLVLSPSDRIQLAGDGALYVHELHISDITQLSGSQNIYYDLRYPANAYLGGQTYALFGGGQLAPVPEPTFTLFGGLMALVLGRRRRNHAH